MTSASYPYIVAWPEVVEAVGEARIAYVARATGTDQPPNQPPSSLAAGGAEHLSNAAKQDSIPSAVGQSLTFPAPAAVLEAGPVRNPATAPSESLGHWIPNPDIVELVAPASLPSPDVQIQHEPSGPEPMHLSSPVQDLLSSPSRGGLHPQRPPPRLSEQLDADIRAATRRDEDPSPGPGIGQGAKWTNTSVRDPSPPVRDPSLPARDLNALGRDPNALGRDPNALQMRAGSRPVPSGRPAPRGAAIGEGGEPTQEDRRAQLSSSGDISEAGYTPSMPPGNSSRRRQR